MYLPKIFYCLLTIVFLLQIPAAYAREKVSRSYRDAAKRYRFEIVLKMPRFRNVSGTVASKAVAEKELARFFAALDQLGEKFVRDSGLNKVVICHNLRLNGMPCSGIAGGGFILLNEGFSAKTVYHEMFHIFDEKRKDKSWQRLNHKKFIYHQIDFPDRPVSKGHKSKLRKRQKKYSNLDFSKDFVSAYAQTEEWEDRAETFAYMVAYGKSFTNKAARSPVLWNKMQYIIDHTSKRSLLSEDYWVRKLGPSIRNKNRFKKH